MTAWLVRLLSFLFPVGRAGTKQILGRLAELEKTLMVSIADLKAKADATLARVQAETNLSTAIKAVVDHQNAMIADLKAQIEALRSQGSASAAELQAVLDTMTTAENLDIANAQKVSDAVVAGTPADESAAQQIPAPAQDA